MVALEASIEKTLDRLSKQASDHPEVASLVSSFHDLSGVQRQTLSARLQTVAGDMVLPDMTAAESDVGESGYPISTALQQASAILNQAIIGYAMLRTIALRFRDSSLIGDVNTGDIAELHTKNYVGAVHKINQLLHNVVLWEMDREGAACQCTCPSCGLGVCLCAQAPRLTLSNIWAELGPISDEVGVFVHTPRSGSAAAEAGLCHGDVVVAADGQELDTHFTLQKVVGGHQSGEAMELQVRRGSGKLEEVTVVRP